MFHFVNKFFFFFNDTATTEIYTLSLHDALPIPPIIRTAGFPQYGWKAGFPSGAFLDDQRLKPAPGMRRPTSSLLPLFVRLVALTLSRSVSGRRLDCAPPWRSLLLRPRGPRSSPGYSVPNRHHLFGPIRPTRR